MKKALNYLAVAALLLAPSCQRETEDRENGGQGETLTVHVEEAVQTRTSYDSDYSVDNFVWENDDEIAILLANAGHTTVTYQIVKITPMSDASWGKFKCSTTNTLKRAHYAVYPASAVETNDSGAPTNYGNTTLHVILPAEYDIKDRLHSYHSPAPMVALNTVETPAAGKAHLEFYHVGGLLRISLGEVNASARKARVIFDKDVTGTFTVSDPGTDHPTIAAGTKTDKNVVTFVLAASSVGTLSDPVILSVPVPCDTYSNIQLQLLDASDSVLDEIILAGPVTIDRHHGWKTVIQSLDFDYAIGTALSDISRSGRNVLHDYSETKTVTVNKTENGVAAGKGPWMAFFSASAPTSAQSPSDWSRTPLPDANGEDWVSLSAYEGDGNANDVTVTLQRTHAATRDLMHDAAAMTTALQAGDGAWNLDLSTYDIITKTTGNTCETANCYVIQKYGSYLIPCVYGNAITNGTTNATAYTYSPLTTPTTGYWWSGGTLSTLVNANGTSITNPVITSDISSHGTLVARVVWQDVLEGYEILSDEDLEFVSSNGTAANCPYIRVNFRKERIMPGNIVIALYDQTNSKILWSWHLWVTAETLETYNVKEYDMSISNDFLNVNIGWTPPVSYAAGTSAARSQHVIIFSTEDGKVVDSFQVSQAAHTQSESATGIYYSNTYYQWGRKDPFLPSNGNGANKAITYPADFPAGNSTMDDGKYQRVATMPISYSDSGSGDDLKRETTPTTLADMIKNPYKMAIRNGVSSHTINTYRNLWNNRANLTQVGSTGLCPETTADMESSVLKTVYDPSPRGFKVPSKRAFSGFIVGGEASSNSSYSYYVAPRLELPSGRYFSISQSTDIDNTYIFYAPITGARDDSYSSFTNLKNAIILTAALSRTDADHTNTQPRTKSIYMSAREGTYAESRGAYSYLIAESVRPVRE